MVLSFISLRNRDIQSARRRARSSRSGAKCEGSPFNGRSGSRPNPFQHAAIADACLWV
jgi:hypothetical protein